jgi:hypothetical protein
MRHRPVLIRDPVRATRRTTLSSATAHDTTTAQARRLVDLGAHDLAGIPAGELLSLAGGLPHPSNGALLAVHPSLVPASSLAPLLERDGRPGFVVEDLTDLDAFTPLETVTVPDAPLYLVSDVARGDDMLNWSPEEAMAGLIERGRTPLTISEGISWLLQGPGRLEPNHCFMCIGSRKVKPGGGLDARTPAIWISGGTGRDGRHRRGAPKVGWCWARNRHTWLGFASAAGRLPPA